MQILYFNLDSDGDFASLKNAELYDYNQCVSRIYRDAKDAEEDLIKMVDDSLSALNYNPERPYLDEVVDEMKAILKSIKDILLCGEPRDSIEHFQNFGNQCIAVVYKEFKLNDAEPYTKFDEFSYGTYF